MRSRSTAWWADALVAAAAFVVLALSAGGTTSIDVISADLGAWQIARTGEPSFESKDAVPLERELVDRLFWHDGPTGEVTVARSPGVLAAGVPAYWVAKRFGHSPFSHVPGALTAALLVAAALFFLLRALDGLLSWSARLAAGLVFVFATPVWSVAADNMWTHTVTVPALLGMAWAARTGRWWMAGLAGGVALWGRAHAALVVGILGVAIAVVRRRPAVAVRMAVPSLALLALAAGWSRWLYGSWNPAGPYRTPGEYARDAATDGLLGNLVNLAGLLVAPDRGLLVWTPVLLLLAPAVARGWREAPDWSRALAAGGAVYLLVQCLLNVFHGGDAFWGYRLPLETLACAAPVYAVTAHRAGRIARVLLAPVIAAQALAIGFGALVGVHLVSQDDAWTRNSFVAAADVLPALWVVMAIVMAGAAYARRSWRRSALAGSDPAAEIPVPG